jgi:hypothetical protein
LADGVEPLRAAGLLAPAAGGAWLGVGDAPAAPAASAAAAFTVAPSVAFSSMARFTMASYAALLHGPLRRGLLVSRDYLIAHRRPDTGELPQPLLQRLILVK